MARRIPVSAPQEGLQSPFAALSLEGLPPGTSEPTAPAPPPKIGRLIFRKEKAHRGGKAVVIASGFSPEFPDAAIQDLARKVRKLLGCGGTVEGREIVWQGDDPEKFRTAVDEVSR